jgi:hypothetical protein
MSRIDTAEQEHYAGRIEGLNWVLDRCQELEDMDAQYHSHDTATCPDGSEIGLGS